MCRWFIGFHDVSNQTFPWQTVKWPEAIPLGHSHRFAPSKSKTWRLHKSHPQSLGGGVIRRCWHMLAMPQCQGTMWKVRDSMCLFFFQYILTYFFVECCCIWAEKRRTLLVYHSLTNEIAFSGCAEPCRAWSSWAPSCTVSDSNCNSQW